MSDGSCHAMLSFIISMNGACVGVCLQVMEDCESLKVATICPKNLVLETRITDEKPNMTTRRMIACHLSCMHNAAKAQNFWILAMYFGGRLLPCDWWLFWATAPAASVCLCEGSTDRRLTISLQMTFTALGCTTVVIAIILALFMNRLLVKQQDD